jgi:uncharacterized protein (DUF302 family)
MSEFAITLEISGKMEEACQRVSEAIKPAGFGVLTRIDFDQKIKEKTGETIPPCTILGACNPRLALEAYRQSSDVALFIPCNIVLTEVGGGKIRVEAMRPTQMLDMLPEVRSAETVINAEKALKECLNSIAVTA